MCCLAGQQLGDARSSHTLHTAATLETERDVLALPPADAPFEQEKLRRAHLTVLAIEEPENSLSPFFLSRIMTQAREIGTLPSAQVVLSSHSASILGRVEPEEIRYFRLDRPQRRAVVRPLTLPADDADARQYVRLAVRAYMDEHPPAAATATEVLNRALSYVGRERLVGAFANYQRPADFERVYQGFLILLTECTAGQAQWSDVLDRLEGLGQVPLMTIHKSKGLEFHTMIFFGLDNRTWWSLNNDGGEEMNSLFVALTRARQRAYFSFCLERGRAFEWLDELLAPVGVQHIDGDLIA